MTKPAITPIRLFLGLLIAISILDFGLACAVHYLIPSLPILIETVLESCLLLILTYPLLLCFVHRPTLAALTRRKQSQTILAEHHEHLSVTLQSIGDAVIATDSHGQITLLNPAAQRLTGWTLDDAMGRPSEDVFHIINEHTRERCANPVALVLESGQATSLRDYTILVAKDGTERVLDDIGSPIRDAGNNVVGAVLIFRDVTATTRLQQHAERANDFNKLLLEALPLGIAIVDTDGTILYGNDTLQAILGTALKGAHCVNLYKEDTRDFRESPLSTTIDFGETRTFEARGLVGGKTIQIIQTPMLYEGRKAILQAFTDISERRKMEESLAATSERLEHANLELLQGRQAILGMLQELQASRNELETANRALRQVDSLKSEFVSTVSHELRTPLAIIKEGINLVLDRITGDITDAQATPLTTARRNIERLTRLIDGLLDISKIEAGKFALTRRVVDIAALLREVATSFALLLSDRHLDLRLRLPDTPLDAFVDPDRILDVFTNLLSNAVKFTETGHIELSLQGDETTVACAVTDTGIGIGEADLPRVFGKFQQFDHPAGMREKGTGLGLAITQAIIRLHGGSISVQSRVGRGTTVRCILPRCASEEVGVGASVR